MSCLKTAFISNLNHPDLDIYKKQRFQIGLLKIKESSYRSPEREESADEGSWTHDEAFFWEREQKNIEFEDKMSVWCQ